jgi:hypothetical protein
VAIFDRPDATVVSEPISAARGRAPAAGLACGQFRVARAPEDVRLRRRDVILGAPGGRTHDRLAGRTVEADAAPGADSLNGFERGFQVVATLCLFLTGLRHVGLRLAIELLRLELGRALGLRSGHLLAIDRRRCAGRR